MTLNLADLDLCNPGLQGFERKSVNGDLIVCETGRATVSVTSFLSMFSALTLELREQMLE